MAVTKHARSATGHSSSLMPILAHASIGGPEDGPARARLAIDRRGAPALGESRPERLTID